MSSNSHSRTDEASEILYHVLECRANRLEEYIKADAEVVNAERSFVANMENKLREIFQRLENLEDRIISSNGESTLRASSISSSHNHSDSGYDSDSEHSGETFVYESDPMPEDYIPSNPRSHMEHGYGSPSSEALNNSRSRDGREAPTSATNHAETPVGSRDHLHHQLGLPRESTETTTESEPVFDRITDLWEALGISGRDESLTHDARPARVDSPPTPIQAEDMIRQNRGETDRELLLGTLESILVTLLSLVGALSERRGNTLG